MNRLTEIYLVRHGQSRHNQEQIVAGQLDSELTEQGFEDARAVARAIRRNDFDVIYSSDLHRARQTAAIILDALKLNCPILFTPLLRELDYGIYTGQSVQDTFRVLNYKWVQDRRYPGGESFQDLEARVAPFVKQLRVEAKGKRVLVTAHAGSIRMLVMLFDPAHRQEYLSQTFSNRYLGKVVLDDKSALFSYLVIQNQSEDLV
jgi:broad specificity phosphatase PhoE